MWCIRKLFPCQNRGRVLIWALVWLTGDARALALSSFERADEAFDLRFGLRWRGHIPFAAIAAIEPLSSTEDDLWNRPWDLKLSLADDPDTLIIASAGSDSSAKVDGRRQNKSTVVVRMFADQVDATGRISHQRRRCAKLVPVRSHHFLLEISLVHNR